MKFKAILITFFSILFITPKVYSQNLDKLELIALENQALKRKFNLKSAPETRHYDVDYYRLDLSLIPSSKHISGNVTTYFTAKDTLSKIVLDLNDQLSVDSVKYGDSLLLFSQSSTHTLEASFPSNLIKGTHDSITVYYHGFPISSQGGFDSFESRLRSVGAPSFDLDTLLWSFSVPYGASDWWPCKNSLDDKADSVELIIHLPYKAKVASNGLLISVDTSGTGATYHWKTNYPIATYLIAIAVADYDVYEEYISIGNDSLLMQHFLYKDQTFSKASQAMEEFLHLYDSLFGSYPFMKEKYGHASFLAGGGMEHQTMSFMSNYESPLKAHEFAHQWFGNKLTCGSWRDVWLNEGFATYLTILTYEFGAFHKKSDLMTQLNNAEVFSYNYRSGSVYRLDTTNVANLFNRQVYEKAAMTLHTLRWEVGDSAFFTGVKNYVNDSNLIYSFARTEDFKVHMEASSGQNLTEFFDDWIYGKGYPIYFSYWSQNAGNFSINVRQTPTHSSVNFFDIPLPYRLIGTNFDTTIIVDPTFSGQTFTFPFTKQVRAVQLDPDNKIFALSGLITGLDQTKDISKEIGIFPNPARDKIYLTSPKEIEITRLVVSNMNGQKLIIKDAASSIDVRSLSSGTYLLELTTSNGPIRKKFIKL